MQGWVWQVMQFPIMKCIEVPTDCMTITDTA